jgi:hypothetical protein
MGSKALGIKECEIVLHDVKRTRFGFRSPAQRCRHDPRPIALFPGIMATPFDSLLEYRASTISMLRRRAGKRVRATEDMALGRQPCLRTL